MHKSNDLDEIYSFDEYAHLVMAGTVLHNKLHLEA